LTPDTLALIGTYLCDLRCSYCPVGKHQGKLPVHLARRAFDLANAAGVLRFRLAGADPFTHPDLLSFMMENLPEGATLKVTTNGVRLTEEWISRINSTRGVQLVLSVDGAKETQLANRLSSHPERDSFSWFERLGGLLCQIPSITVNMVISPDQVHLLVQNVAYLSGKGFFRLNLLPAYYVPWSDDQKSELKEQFRRLAAFLDRGRTQGLPFEIVNIDNDMPQPLYRDELVLDIDGEFYSSDIITAGVFGNDKVNYSLGNIENIDSFDYLRDNLKSNWHVLLEQRLGKRIVADTRAVDELLSEFVAVLKSAGF
jgi:MoaA/NifB/PqqE/SkfB family radical SAM enzyme